MSLGDWLVSALAELLDVPPPPPPKTAAPWWAKFAPPKPKGAPVTNPAPAPDANAVAALILAQNHKVPFVLGIHEYVVALKGVTIHEIDGATALRLANDVLAGCNRYGLPPAFLMGCIAIESCFDPGCLNGNFLGSNPSHAPEGFDDGVAQEKLRYLIGTNGITTVDEARAFALDPDKAIPYMAAVMQGKLAWADAQIAGMAGSSSIIEQYRNRYYLATQTYNWGTSGMLSHLYTDTAAPAHGQHVVHLERAFASALHLPSVFPADF